MISKDKKRLTITLKNQSYDTLKLLAKKSNVTISKVIEGLILLSILSFGKEEKEND